MALGRGWKVLMVTSVAVYLVALDVTVVNIAFPSMARDFPGTSRAFLSWVLSGYNIAFAASLLTAGRLADRFGRRRVFFLGLGVFTTASALCGLAPSPGWLVAARVLQAIGGALVMPSSLALVLPEFPMERRSAAIGVWGAVGGLAAATGPSLGGVLIEWSSWRAVFFINMPFCLLAFVLGRRLLIESREAVDGVPDVLGAVLGATSVGLLVLAIVQGDEWGYTNARTFGAVAVAVALGPWFVRRCRRHPVPVFDLALLQHRFFTVANVASFLFSVGFFAMIFVNVQFLIGVWGYSIIGAGLALTPGPLLAGVFAVPAGRWADRYGHRAVIGPGALLFATGIGLVAWRLETTPDYWGVWFPGYVVAGIGVGLTISALGAAANKYLPPNRFGMGSAVNTTLRQIGAALGVAFAVNIIGRPAVSEVLDHFTRAYWLLASTSVAAAVVMLAFYRPPLPGDPVATTGEVVVTG